MLRSTILFACLLGITLGGGGIFQMTEEEIAKSMELQNGMDIAVEQLNMKNDRKENDYRCVEILCLMPRPIYQLFFCFMHIWFFKII